MTTLAAPSNQSIKHKNNRLTASSNPYLSGGTYSKFEDNKAKNCTSIINKNVNRGSLAGHSSAFPKHFQHNGYLDVRTRQNKSWKRRYFVVSNNFLLCAATPHAHELEKVIPLEGSGVNKSTNHSDMTFELFFRKVRLYFRAGSPQQCEKWTKAIEKASKLKIQEVYRFIHTLGVSGDTKVVAAKHRTTNEDCAVKIVDKRLCNQSMLRNEIKILRKLDHPSIVRLYDIVETKKFLYIVMEKCGGGELFDQIAELDGDHYDERDSCVIMHQIAAGVRYMHSVGIVHRDLKPENVLCVKPNSIRKVKIADFGISAILKNPNQQMKTMVGTLSYTAPEILQNRRNYDYTVDYWSVGVIMYILLCGYPPFWGETDEEIIASIIKCEPDFDPDEWDHVHPKTIELVRGLLCKIPSNRCSLDDILQLTWKVSSQSLAFKKSRLRLKKHVINKKMRAMSSGIYEVDSHITRHIGQTIKRYNNKSISNSFYGNSASRIQFADDMSPAFDAKQRIMSKFNRNVVAFRGKRNSKGTEELYHDLTELRLPLTPSVESSSSSSMRSNRS